jgi:hypothetical protein
VNQLFKSLILIAILLLTGCYVRPLGVRYSINTPAVVYRNHIYPHSFRYPFDFHVIYPHLYPRIRIYPYSPYYHYDRFKGYAPRGYYRWR